MEIFYVLTKNVQSRLLQNCRMRERVNGTSKKVTYFIADIFWSIVVGKIYIFIWCSKGRDLWSDQGLFWRPSTVLTIYFYNVFPIEIMFDLFTINIWGNKSDAHVFLTNWNNLYTLCRDLQCTKWKLVPIYFQIKPVFLDKKIWALYCHSKKFSMKYYSF